MTITHTKSKGEHPVTGKMCTKWHITAYMTFTTLDERVYIFYGGTLEKALNRYKNEVIPQYFANAQYLAK
jgi:hypothetical protein